MKNIKTFVIKHPAAKWILRMINSAAGGYFLLIAVLYLFQANLIFFPQKITLEYASHLKAIYPNLREINIKTPDGAALHGWLLKNTAAKQTPLIIYYGGNGDEASWIIEDGLKLKNWSLLLMNYRGYGLSEGVPGEKCLCNDAIYVYDLFARRKDVDKDGIVVMGRSIGSGVAVYVAERRPLRGVVLITPYDSVTSVARERMPFIPVSLILKHRFESISRAPKIRSPVLVMVAEKDEVIPPWHAMRLAKAWGGETAVHVIKNAGHNTIQNDDDYWRYIGDFLIRFLPRHERRTIR
ncbi:MAG: alpha/beta hydrolase [Bacillota bacterium]